MDKINKSINNIKNNCLSWLKENKNITIMFSILMAIYLMAMIPIFRSNFNYIDDIGRVVGGYREWWYFSRFFSEVFSIFVHTSRYLTDISPLPQIMSIVILCICGMIIVKLFGNNDKKVRIFEVLAVLLIGLNPAFLECLSYKYDSPYMTFSIFFSLVPFLFYKDNLGIKKNYLFVLASVIGMIFVCMSYQAATGIYPIVTMFLAFKYFNNGNNKEAINVIVTSLIGYVLGVLIFKTFIMIPTDTYVSNTLYSLKDMIPGIFNHLGEYYSIILEYRRIWLLCIVLIFISFIINSVIDSKQNKVLATVMAIVLVILSLGLCFGLYPALEKPLIAPRSMFGFGMLVTLLSINVVNKDSKILTKMIVLGLAYCFFTFSFTYGNALNIQKEYAMVRMQNVLDGLNEVSYMNNNNIKNIQIQGSIGFSPAIDYMAGDYRKVLNRLVPEYFGSDFWNVQYFRRYFKIRNVNFNDEVDMSKKKLRTLKDTMYYTIKGDKDNILIILK